MVVHRGQHLRPQHINDGASVLSQVRDSVHAEDSASESSPAFWPWRRFTFSGRDAGLFTLVGEGPENLFIACCGGLPCCDVGAGPVCANIRSGSCDTGFCAQ
jgi:hypothetical protein